MALMFLNGDGMRGGRAHYTIEGVPLVGERRTAPLYRFFSVRDEFPALYPVAEGGQPILGELYDVPMGPLNALLATEPPELELSIVELEGGELSSRWCCARPSTPWAFTRTSPATAVARLTAPAWYYSRGFTLSANVRALRDRLHGCQCGCARGGCDGK